MKCDLLIAGVGGQGILTIAAILGRAALGSGLHVKQSEVHGMAQRGGAVQSHFRMSSDPIASDLVPRGAADLVLSMEPMEALRYLPWLGPAGWLITNDEPILNTAAYPDPAAVRAAVARRPRHVLFNGTALASAAGSPRAMNVAMLGAASAVIGLPESAFAAAIRDQFGEKGEKVVATNLAVFASARELARRAVAAAGP